MLNVFNQVIEIVCNQKSIQAEKCRSTCLHYKPQMFVSCNKHLGSVQTRHYKCVNYPELTGNQLGAKNWSVDLSSETAVYNGAFI